MINLLQKAFKSAGYSLEKTKNKYPDLDPDFWDLHRKARPFTMTSTERMYALYQATHYVTTNNIEGAITECGVWKGGSAMMGAITLMHLNDQNRSIYLYDTYEGMSEPTEKDISIHNENMRQQWSDISKSDRVFCYSTLEEVQQNLYSTGYPKERLHFVKGKVEETIPKTIPEKIALLRLDTDWYESTYHELKHLYPKLQRGGVLILDDYGHWKGAREAVDQYFSEIMIKPLLQRIDYTGRMMIKS